MPETTCSTNRGIVRILKPMKIGLTGNITEEGTQLLLEDKNVMIFSGNCWERQSR